MKMKKILLIYIIIIIFVNISFTQTYVSGIISSNTTWTSSNSPFIVTDTVVVLQSVRLTIEPGVTIRFDSTKFMDIRGSLYAEGTLHDTIYFTSNDPQNNLGDWEGIRLGSTDSIKFYYCMFSYANSAIIPDNTEMDLINLKEQDH